MANNLKTSFIFRIALVQFFCLISMARLFGQTAVAVQDSITIRSLFNQALTGERMNSDLLYLTKKIGPRISGSVNAQKAVEWAKMRMDEIAPDTVYLQEVVVPHWVRGTPERSFFSDGGKKVNMQVCALGGSVKTNGLLKAKVVEVKSWAELNALKDGDLKGKFVFFNRAMDPLEIETYKAYLGAVDQRSKGAIEAAKRGAIGVLVRSLTELADDVPHTGSVNYESSTVRIPAAAISIISANKLSSALKENPDLLYTLKMDCVQMPDVKSYNVIGEIRGTRFPNEFISVGGHLDSWDLAEGAADDGTGVVQTLEVLRLLKNNRSRPERSFRAILYMNEESGAHGAVQYAKIAAEKKEIHDAVIESDVGGFTPRGFRINGTPTAFAKLSSWHHFFVPYKVGELNTNQRGIDLIPMKGIAKALISLECDDQRFFDIHHSASDTYDKLNIREVKLGAASMASLAYLILKYGFED